MPCESGSKITIEAPERTMPFRFVSPPATTFPNLFTQATWKRPEANPHSRRKKTADLLTGFPPQGTVEGKICNIMLFRRARSQKRTTSQDCTMLPDPKVSSGYELDW